MDHINRSKNERCLKSLHGDFLHAGRNVDMRLPTLDRQTGIDAMSLLYGDHALYLLTGR